MIKLFSYAKDKLKNIVANFSFSPNILDHLGLSAYNSIQKSLVELISNSYDADAKQVSISIPEKIDENSKIIIKDDGHGMTLDEFQKNYLYIGRNRRNNSTDITKLGRKIIGHKGIGKLAGFGIAENVKIETMKDGFVTLADLKKDDFKIKKALSKYKFDVHTHETDNKNSSGTIITLTGLKQKLKIPELKFLRRYLRNQLPGDQKFTIYVNDEECTNKDILGKRYTFKETINSIGKEVSGFYIITKSNTKHAGIAVRVRGRLVTKPNFFNVELDSFKGYLSRKFTGEINADFMDDNSHGNQSLINTTRDGFIEGNMIVESFNEWAKDFIKKTLEKERKEIVNNQTKNIFSSEKIKKRLDQLPSSVQFKAKTMISHAVPKLEDIKDQSNFADLILKYFESNTLKELLESILQSNDKDIEKLSDMITEWGVREVSNITDIVTQQIKIIKKLSKLIDDSKTLEKDIHKIFEHNIWLLSENYKLWASNNQLKKILDNNIDERYKNKENLRPDIICRTNDNKVVIIEFKRPNEKITLEHLAQVMRYKTIIKKSMPNLKDVTTYLIGKEYEQEIIDNKEDQSQAKNFVYSFSEVLAQAEKRFKTILDIIDPS